MQASLEVSCDQRFLKLTTFIAFQLIDDVLDYSGLGDFSSLSLKK